MGKKTVKDVWKQLVNQSIEILLATNQTRIQKLHWDSLLLHLNVFVFEPLMVIFQNFQTFH